MNWPSGDPNQPPAYAPPPPPPMPYQHPSGQPPAPPGAYHYPVPKKSRTGLFLALAAVAVVIIGAIIAVGVIAYVKTKDKVIATDLKVGDCLTDIPNSALVSLVPTVDCAKPHSGEVYAVLTMPDGAYPGEATIDEWQNKCPSALESYSPDAIADETIGMFVLYPTADTWAKGDRAVTCIATTDDKRSGSVKG